LTVSVQAGFRADWPFPVSLVSAPVGRSRSIWFPRRLAVPGLSVCRRLTVSDQAGFRADCPFLGCPFSPVEFAR